MLELKRVNQSLMMRDFTRLLELFVFANIKTVCKSLTGTRTV